MIFAFLRTTLYLCNSGRRVQHFHEGLWVTRGALMARSYTPSGVAVQGSIHGGSLVSQVRIWHKPQPRESKIGQNHQDFKVDVLEYGLYLVLFFFFFTIFLLLFLDIHGSQIWSWLLLLLLQYLRYRFSISSISCVQRRKCIYLGVCARVCAELGLFRVFARWACWRIIVA